MHSVLLGFPQEKPMRKLAGQPRATVIVSATKMSPCSDDSQEPWRLASPYSFIQPADLPPDVLFEATFGESWEPPTKQKASKPGTCLHKWAKHRFLQGLSKEDIALLRKISVEGRILFALSLLLPFSPVSALRGTMGKNKTRILSLSSPRTAVEDQRFQKEFTLEIQKGNK